MWKCIREIKVTEMARGLVPAIISRGCTHELNTITRDFFSEINGSVEKMTRKRVVDINLTIFQPYKGKKT